MYLKSVKVVYDFLFNTLILCGFYLCSFVFLQKILILKEVTKELRFNLLKTPQKIKQGK
jgi:hypothetical protein